MQTDEAIKQKNSLIRLLTHQLLLRDNIIESTTELLKEQEIEASMGATI